jgi:hypothetical protein
LGELGADFWKLTDVVRLLRKRYVTVMKY